MVRYGFAGFVAAFSVRAASQYGSRLPAFASPLPNRVADGEKHDQAPGVVRGEAVAEAGSAPGVVVTADHRGRDQDAAYGGDVGIELSRLRSVFRLGREAAGRIGPKTPWSARTPVTSAAATVSPSLGVGPVFIPA